MATGAIWTRWCLIIKPRNVLYVLILSALFPRTLANATFFFSLAAVNFFLGCVGVVQVSRIFMWQRSQKGSSLEAAHELEHEAVDSAKAVVDQAETAVKAAGEKTA
jgi:hypothetical protein